MVNAKSGIPVGVCKRDYGFYFCGLFIFVFSVIKFIVNYHEAVRAYSAVRNINVARLAQSV